MRRRGISLTEYFEPHDPLTWAIYDEVLLIGALHYENEPDERSQ